MTNTYILAYTEVMVARTLKDSSHFFRTIYMCTYIYCFAWRLNRGDHTVSYVYSIL